MKAEAKVNKISAPIEVDDIDAYLSYFKEKNNNLDSVIKNLDDEISDLKKQIKDTQSDLKKQLDELAKKNKSINSKLHDVSGDYNEADLINAAEELKELRINKEKVESDSNDKLEELRNSLRNIETDRTENLNIKANTTDITNTATKELKEVNKKYASIFAAISKAIEICDNSNLEIALEEEISSRETSLLDVSNKYKEQIDKYLKTQESNIELKEEIKKPENNTEDLFKNKKVINILSSNEESKIIVEPKKSKAKIEIPEITIDLPKEEPLNEDRKVIDIKTISENQKTAIENSSIVEKGLKNFFN